MNGIEVVVNPEKPRSYLTLPHSTGRFPPTPERSTALAAAAPSIARFERGDVVPEGPEVERSGRILVVDDEPHIRRFLQAILGKQGFEVVVSSDGTAGFAQFQSDSFDLVILDLMMPGASGLEILSRIRAEPTRSETPVIILTAKGQDTDRDAAIAGGAIDFLTKPFSPKKLIARIEEILGDA